jgi:hypothetical protein
MISECRNTVQEHVKTALGRGKYECTGHTEKWHGDLKNANS